MYTFTCDYKYIDTLGLRRAQGQSEITNISRLLDGETISDKRTLGGYRQPHAPNPLLEMSVLVDSYIAAEFP